MKKIEIVNLHKTLGDKYVLRGIDLDIEQGKTLAIIGQSGSGKSVLIKHLVGLIKPDKGKIFVDGTEITGLDEENLRLIRKKFGMLFQGGALFDSLTVGQNVSFGLENYTDLSPTEIQKKTKESLIKVGLRDIEELMPHELSGGMKKRVALARAIAYDPEIILYDEPSTGIDPIRADAINDLINMMRDDMGMTSVVITHDLVSSYKVADRMAMLYEGKIIETGTPDEIKNTENHVLQQFLNGSAEGPLKNW